MVQSSGRLKRALLVTIKLAVSVGLLAYVLRQADLPRLVDHVRALDVRWLIPITGAWLLVLIVSGWRWQVLLRAQHVDVRARTLYESFLVAQFFNNFLPSNIGGDVIRVADTAAVAGSRTLATTVILVDRALGLLALFVVAALGSFVAGQRGTPVPGAGYLWMVVAVSAVLSAALLAMPHLFPAMLAPLRRLEHEWIDERLIRLESAFHRFVQARLSLLQAFVGALVVQGVSVVLYLLLARAMGIPLPVLTAAVLIPVSFVVQMLPVAINGFGVREAVYIYFFTHAGLGLEPAVALSLVGAGLTVILSLSGGVLFAMRGRDAKLRNAECGRRSAPNPPIQQSTNPPIHHQSAIRNPHSEI